MAITEEQLNSAENTCIEAVQYVGHANYAEREEEAIESVMEAFTELKKELLKKEES